MSLLLESIRVLDGEYYNLSYHEQRMNRSLHELCGVRENLDLERFLRNFKTPSSGLYKCRMVYDDETRDIEFIEYKAKPIASLKLVADDQIGYDFKFADRRSLDRLYKLKGSCDDILILKNGLVTDSSFANVVFKRGSHWITPWSALLKGTMRQQLIEQNRIEEEDIRKEDISTFESVKLINAMVGFEGPEIEVSNIVF